MLIEIKKPVYLLTASIVLQSFSFLSIKLSTLQGGYYSIILLIVAFGFIGLRLIFWQYLLKLTELSRVYPYAALVQVLIFLYAVVLFNEPVTVNNVIGLFMMLGGIFIMSRRNFQ